MENSCMMLLETKLVRAVRVKQNRKVEAHKSEAVGTEGRDKVG